MENEQQQQQQKSIVHSNHHKDKISIVAFSEIQNKTKNKKKSFKIIQYMNEKSN